MAQPSKHTRLLGLHTGIAGGLQRSVEEAHRKGCRTWQIFSRNPRGWTARPLAKDEIRLFRQARDESGLDPCVIHACYLINLAATALEVRARSIACFRDEIERGLAIGADYLVVHPGSTGGAPIEDAIASCAAAIREATSGLKERMQNASFRILIENTAGQGNQIGRSFEQVSQIIAAASELEMGMCLDTAHSFAAGYDWRDGKASVKAFKRLDETVGLRNVRAVHFNDSKASFASQVDRHWHIGEGEIGREGLARVINHPRLRSLPFILETPRDNDQRDLSNLAAASQLIA